MDRLATIAGVALLFAMAAWGTEPVGVSVGVETSHCAPVTVVYFHSPTCEHCAKVKEFLPRVQADWADRVLVESYSVEEERGLALLLAYLEQAGVENAGPPVVFINGRCLHGADAILSGLDKAIEEEIADPGVWLKPQGLGGAAETGKEDVESPGGSAIQAKYESFDIAAVAVAGLVDGINPCAFTTIIFLLSMLAMLGRGRRDLITVGVGFTAAIFCTYLALGLGLMVAVKAFAVHAGISRGAAVAVGMLALILAGWSLLDAYRYARGGNVKDVTLGLPKPLRQRINRAIREGMKTRTLVLGAVTTGVAVALLESLCTGQVYLPTIVYVARSRPLASGAVGYLALYNLMFILPLAGLVVLAYTGVRSERLGDFLRKHLMAFKLAMAAVFAMMGVMVLASV